MNRNLSMNLCSLNDNTLEGFDLLVGERYDEVFFSAGTRGHVFFLIIKFVVTCLGTSDQLSQWIVLQIRTA